MALRTMCKYSTLLTLSIPLILWYFHVFIKLFLMLTNLSLPLFIGRQNFLILWIHLWILSIACPDSCCPHLCHESWAISPNVARLSTFVACDLHATAFPFRQLQQGFLLIAWLCQAISILNHCLFRIQCIVCAWCLHAIHHIFSPYDSPCLAHWRLSVVCSWLCVACCCVCTFHEPHPMIIMGWLLNHSSSFIKLPYSVEFGVIALSQHLIA